MKNFAKQYWVEFKEMWKVKSFYLILLLIIISYSTMYFRFAALSFIILYWPAAMTFIISRKQKAQNDEAPR